MTAHGVGGLTARSDGTTCVVNADELVVYGGVVGHKIWTLNLETFVWREVVCGGEVPPGRLYHSAVAYGGAMLVYGGELTASTADVDQSQYYELDLTTHTWRAVKTFGSDPGHRSHHTASMVNGKMYVLGGRPTLYGRAAPQTAGSVAGDVERGFYSMFILDVSGRAWQKVERYDAIHPLVWGHSATVFRHFILYFGGFHLCPEEIRGDDPSSGGVDPDAAPSAMLGAAVHTYNTETMAWSISSPKMGRRSPGPRALHVAATCLAEMFVYGGMHIDETGCSNTLTDAWYWDIATGEWTPVPDFCIASARAKRLFTVVHGSKLCVCAGIGSIYKLDLRQRHLGWAEYQCNPKALCKSEKAPGQGAGQRLPARSASPKGVGLPHPAPSTPPPKQQRERLDPAAAAAAAAALNLSTADLELLGLANSTTTTTANANANARSVTPGSLAQLYPATTVPGPPPPSSPLRAHHRTSASASPARDGPDDNAGSGMPAWMAGGSTTPAAAGAGAGSHKPTVSFADAAAAAAAGASTPLVPYERDQGWGDVMQMMNGSGGGGGNGAANPSAPVPATAAAAAGEVTALHRQLHDLQLQLSQLTGAQRQAVVQEVLGQAQQQQPQQPASPARQASASVGSTGARAVTFQTPGVVPRAPQDAAAAAARTAASQEVADLHEQLRALQAQQEALQQSQEQRKQELLDELQWPQAPPPQDTVTTSPPIPHPLAGHSLAPLIRPPPRAPSMEQQLLQAQQQQHQHANGTAAQHPPQTLEEYAARTAPPHAMEGVPTLSGQEKLKNYRRHKRSAGASGGGASTVSGVVHGVGAGAGVPASTPGPGPGAGGDHRGERRMKHLSALQAQLQAIEQDVESTADPQFAYGRLPAGSVGEPGVGAGLLHAHQLPASAYGGSLPPQRSVVGGGYSMTPTRSPSRAVHAAEAAAVAAAHPPPGAAAVATLAAAADPNRQFQDDLAHYAHNLRFTQHQIDYHKQHQQLLQMLQAPLPVAGGGAATTSAPRSPPPAAPAVQPVPPRPLTQLPGAGPAEWNTLKDLLGDEYAQIDTGDFPIGRLLTPPGSPGAGVVL